MGLQATSGEVVWRSTLQCGECAKSDMGRRIMPQPISLELTFYFSHFSKCYKIKNLTGEEATLLEPASCAIHGMDKLKMPFGAKVLLIGAGPTGLILAQLMKVSRGIDSTRLG